MMEFHISRAARDRYHFDQDLFSLSGNVIFANFQAVRQFAYLMGLHARPGKAKRSPAKAGEINAMGMIDEILHLVVELYRREIDPQVMHKAERYLNAQYGKKQVDRALLRFIDEFPPIPVYRGTQQKADYLKASSAGRANREIVLEELMLLWLANVNPAFSAYAELFDDSGMKNDTAYLTFIDTLFSFFDKQSFFGPEHQNLLVMLRAPAVASPNSLQGQIEYIRQHWSGLLGDYLKRLLGSLDFLSEQDKVVIPGGPAPSEVYQYDLLEGEIERFSRDSDWMPNCVLFAKNTYVWLDQLSRRHQREIIHLDQIPDEELDRLAQLGMNGLWLIGLWERSPASQRIKQLCGNPDAVASAYSLAEYRIASDLGGDQAYAKLRDRAAAHGVRLASDMVPNHMGLDSGWVIDHPDWFLSLDYSPFPIYSFNGPDLSSNPRVGLYLEDHYYTKNDAAVVFKRVDRKTGREQYVYHGNDGTNMPWNDTAQLNYLNPQVREAVIQTILAVARRFPIIRFDAAMTLAKKHYQRLWFPEPGSGGDIPTRSDFGMDKKDFDRAMPREFWREVVDRVAKEAPDTLLLAEAFWMMEGFFVRSLGMHRVYNSAFMNMLRDEKNAKYRQVIKNTLEFDPQILKRYVNFMNNPDEETAVEQFGKGDKYFGICTLMASMPGLPMFGHGQIEGFTEKYGMEYRRARLDEGVDETLVDRHRREIAPLLHQRRLFSEVEHFLLFDFFTGNGQVNEDVFAYSNRAGEKSALVVYNNRFNHTDGWIKRSAAYTHKTGSARRLVQTDIGEGLALGKHPDSFVIFREQNSGLEYIRSCQGIHRDGMHFELDAYQSKVLLDFRKVTTSQQRDYARLAAQLGERGVPSIENAVSEMDLLPILTPFRALIASERLHSLLDARPEKANETKATRAAKGIRQDALLFFRAAGWKLGVDVDAADLANTTIKRLETLLGLPVLLKRHRLPAASQLKTALTALSSLPREAEADWLGLIYWICLAPLGKLLKTSTSNRAMRELLDDWHLSQEIQLSLQQYDLQPEMMAETRHLVTGMLSLSNRDYGSMSERIADIFKDPDLSAYLGVNNYNNVLWFNREAFRKMTYWLMATSTLEAVTGRSSESTLAERLLATHADMKLIRKAGKQSDYQVARLIEALGRIRPISS